MQIKRSNIASSFPMQITDIMRLVLVLIRKNSATCAKPLLSRPFFTLFFVSVAQRPGTRSGQTGRWVYDVESC